jgi:DNA-binding GntR family transcriptional regulator
MMEPRSGTAVTAVEQGTPAMPARRPDGSGSLAADVAARLRTAIMDGAFELGEALSEDLVSSAFGVSRTPVREALRTLRTQGLVEIVPKSGTYIFRPSVEQLHELCECRLRLECAAVELALETDPERLRSTLDGLLAPMREALDAADFLRYNQLDAQFHLAFLDCCGNRYLRSAYDLIYAQISAIRVHLSVRTAGAFDESMREHHTVVELVAGRDVTGLVTVLGHHIDRAKQVYATSLQERERSSRLSRGQRIRNKLSL